MYITSTGTTKYTLHGKNIVHLTNGSNSLHFFYDAQNKPAVVVNGVLTGSRRLTAQVQGSRIKLLHALPLLLRPVFSQRPSNRQPRRICSRDNDPVMRKDPAGAFRDTFFDTVLLAVGVCAVIADPADSWARTGWVMCPVLERLPAKPVTS